MYKTLIVLTALAVVCGGGMPAYAADPIGAAAKVEDTLTGPAGKLETGGSVYFNDVLKTDATGVGQIIFKDDTKLAIGPNAEVKIDKFVYNDDGSFKELAVGMTKGAFRWISGKSKPEAYKLSTGWANLAIRGTAFDLSVDPAGSLTLVLYNGEVTVCLAIGECRIVQGRCSYLVSKTRVDVSDPERLPRRTAVELKQSGLLPFIDNERLSRPFHLKNASCKVRKAQRAPRTQRAQLTPQTKSAAFSVPPVVTRSGRLASSPDPTPSVDPDPVDPPTSTDPDPKDHKGHKGHKGGHGHHGKGHHGKGNPGNDGDNGHAGESPGGGDFGGGTKGKGDTNGKNGKGGKGGHGGDD
jgi:hypothetical protein